MGERLREAFAAVEAEEELKDRTQAYLFRKTQGYSARKAAGRAGPMGWAVAVACLVLFAGLGAGLFFTPVSAISIDINPSLELNVNCFDRVVSVEGFNEDGRKLAERLQVRFMGYPAALDAVLAEESVQSRLADGEPLSIYVACDDEQRGGAMLDEVRHCAGRGRNIHCQAGSRETEEAAHAAGLSCGKYRAFLELQALDPTVLPEDVQGLTMREIREKIAALSGKGTAWPGCGKGNGCGQGKRHGQGAGCAQEG